MKTSDNLSHCFVNKCRLPAYKTLRIGLKHRTWRYIPICFMHYYKYYIEKLPTDLFTKNLKQSVEIGRLDKFIVSKTLVEVPYKKRKRVIDIVLK